jgi:hypothetical protein
MAGNALKCRHNFLKIETPFQITVEIGRPAELNGLQIELFGDESISPFACFLKRIIME